VQSGFGSDELLPRGAEIGRYTVVGLVGRGAMGDVYAAKDPRLGRKVAVKLVRTGAGDGQANAEARVRLLREAQVIAKLSHPNVVVVHDVGTFGDNVFVAMEYVEGHTVTAWLLAGQRTIPEILALYTAAGRGLEAAHRVGLIHRDFKPDNVMVGRDGQVRVMDFGLARQISRGMDSVEIATERKTAPSFDALHPTSAAAIDVGATQPLTPHAAGAHAALSDPLLDAQLTQAGAIMGTPAYMAPEQFLGRVTTARTDQFSFCVSLYEAIYGRRPFPGENILTLTTGVLAGVVTEPPRDSKVPAAIRRALLRGLALDPKARWPSMTALLHALRYDPARPLRRGLMVTGAVVGGLLVATTAVSWRAAHAPPPICRAGDDKLAAVWPPEAGETGRKATVRRAFQKTGKPYAADAFASVQRTLDRYAGVWKTMYEEACQATHVRGDQSAEVMDLRMSCLGERLGRLRALVDVLADANATVVENAAGAAGALPSLDRCADVSLLRTVVAPPDGAEAQARVATLRHEVARVEAMGNAGQCGPSVDDGRKLVVEARSLGYGPLEAEALNALAGAGASCLDPGEAVELRKQALRAAVASRDDEAAVSAALHAARLLADQPAAAREARDWLELGRALLRATRGTHALLEWRALSAEGLVARSEGDKAAAVDKLTRALALGESTLGSDNLEIAAALANLGTALASDGRLEESITYFDRARRLAARLLGPDHPQVAVRLAERSRALDAFGLHAEAVEDGRRAVEIWKAAGASPLLVARGLTSLAESLFALGRPEEAAPLLEEALRDHEASSSPASPEIRFALARALWRGPQHRVRAVSLAEAARAEYARAGGDRTHLAAIDTWLKAHPSP